ncbi:MAG: 1-deoxy-D-xylulose-5-phosphate reductoisomerase [Victivallales bacterium]|nr:1-deoxy-D-xylulose-5-phosphate reductoisomerase [Victivallales bacterium]
MKNIVILGSTGSIGRNTVEVVKNLKNMFRVVGLAANKNIELLEKQARELGCRKIVCNKEYVRELQKRLGKDFEVEHGTEGMVELSVQTEVDIVLCAVVGTAALLPVLEALKNGKDIAIASKEILVMAGEIVMKTAEKNNVRLLPVDSEHSAIFQCLEGKKKNDISKLVLTASGGAFRNTDKAELKKATLENALKHPTWSMGRKVTIDSASLMNKALEIIEAKWMFGVTPNQIDVLIHPQSIIHSMVEFVDGTFLAQLSVTDMKFPIQYALAYPEKIPGGLEKLNLAEIKSLSFYEPDRTKFPSLDFAFYALKTGGTMPAVMNAANELAVEKFIGGEIYFTEIWDIIENIMNEHKVVENPTLEQIIDADSWAKNRLK